MKEVNEPSRLKKLRWLLFLMGWFQIPMIGFVRPKLISIDDQKVQVRIRLRRGTRNHLKSMYFGALAVGADIAAGIHVFYFAQQTGLKVSFAFKAMNAEFLKRAESNVVFTCEEGVLIKEMLESSKQLGERLNQKVTVIAKDENNEVVATFEMTVSVKAT